MTLAVNLTNITPIFNGTLNNPVTCNCFFGSADTVILIILGIIVYSYLITEIINKILVRSKKTPIDYGDGIFSFAVIVFFCFFKTVTPELLINFMVVIGLIVLKKYI